MLKIALVFILCFGSISVIAQSMERAEIELLDFWRNTFSEIPGSQTSISSQSVEPNLLKLANLVVTAENNFRKASKDSSCWHDLENVISALRERKFIIATAFVQFQLSKMLYHNNQAVEAIELILQCKEVLKTEKQQKAFPHLGSFYAFLGDIYIDNGEPLLALATFNNATKFSFANLLDKYYCYGNIGFTYFELDKTKEALNASFKALEIIRQIGDSTESASMLGNIGSIYLKQGDCGKALTYLACDYSQSIASQNWNSAAAVQIKRAQAFLCLTQYDQARAALKVADSIYEFCKCSIVGAKKEYYEQLLKLSSKTKDVSGYIKNADSLIYYSNKFSDHIRKNVSNFSGAQLTVVTKLHETKMLLLASEQKRQMLIRNLIIAVCILLLVVVMFVLINQRQARKSEKRMYELNLNNSKKQLDSYLENIRNKNRILADLQQQLKDNITEQTNSTSASLQKERDIELAEKLEKASLITEESWLEFIALVEQVHHHFFIKLNLAFPNLTPAEIRLATLIKLKFSIKDSAVMLGISSDSIKKARYRLKKKVNGGNELSLEEIINNI